MVFFIHSWRQQRVIANTDDKVIIATFPNMDLCAINNHQYVFTVYEV